MASTEKTRLDVLLVELKYAASREQAQRMILAGEVRIEGRVVDKPGARVPRLSAGEIEVTPSAQEFVSRAGHKLAGALKTFGIAVSGRVCLDVGASTGGFTDCLLQNGAAKVYAVDVGHGQLAWKIRQDSRVEVREKVNARNLSAEDFKPAPDFAVVDVSFISLKLVLPAIFGALAEPREIVCLIKPQFELGRELVPRGGVVRDPVMREKAVAMIRQFVEVNLKAQWINSCPSALAGTDGNQEYLAWIKP